MSSGSANGLFQQNATAHTNPWSVGTSVAVNGGILAILLCVGLGTHIPAHLPQPTHGSISLRDLTIFAPPSARGGNGGGNHDLLPAIEGRIPQFERTPIVPPQVQALNKPILAINPAITVPPDVKLPDNPTLPNLGVYRSSNTIILSNGSGSDAGIGSGKHSGVGPGEGNTGWGPGTGPGVYTPGVNGVSAPVPLFQPEAEFSDEARRQKYQGVCMISLIVDTHGNPQNPRVVHPLGMGLDEKALQAVQLYRFKPAMKDGRPVPVAITVAVNFRLF
jgi:TonB family protein